jgi:exosortase D (VPLPA-CTERM-specific)
MLVRSVRVYQSTSSRTLLLVVGAVLFLIFLFNQALAELVNRWIRQEEYSHGFLVPVVSLWFLWSRRAAIAASVGQPAWTGAILLLCAMALHLLGELSAIFVFSQVAFVLALIGVVLALGGYPLLRVTFIAIVFLVFAIPLPYFLESTLTLKLQLISSELGVAVIKLFGIPVYLEGNVIDLGFYKIAVVEACSGLRYLYPLLSLGFLAAYLFQAPVWQRTLVFLSTIPITIGMNGFRIGMVGVTVDRWGPVMAGEVLHFFEGWIIFLACAAILVLEIFIFARVSGKTFFQVFHVSTVAIEPPPARAAVSRTPMIASLLVLVSAAVALHFVSGRPEILPERARFASFPGKIGPWQGRTSLLDPGTERGLGLDDYILSDYVKSDGRAVNLYIAYYSSQRKGLSPHSPLVCIPGGGWLITKFDRTADTGAGVEMPLNRVIIERDSQRELVYYWFDERGRRIADEYWAKWYLLADAIMKNRTDGALVRLTTLIVPGESERDADDRLRSFMRDLVPTLAQYLPAASPPQVKSALGGPSGRKL